MPCEMKRTAPHASLMYNGNSPPFPSRTGWSVGEIFCCTTAPVSRNSSDRMSVAKITLNSNTAVNSSAIAFKTTCEGGENAPSLHPIQFLGPSQNVKRPLHPCGSSLGGGIPPGVIQRAGLKAEASGPQTEGFVFMVVNGMWKTCAHSLIISKGWSFVGRNKGRMDKRKEEGDRLTCPARTFKFFTTLPSFPRMGLLRGSTSSLSATRSVSGDDG